MPLPAEFEVKAVLVNVSVPVYMECILIAPPLYSIFLFDSNVLLEIVRVRPLSGAIIKKGPSLASTFFRTNVVAEIDAQNEHKIAFLMILLAGVGYWRVNVVS